MLTFLVIVIALLLTILGFVIYHSLRWARIIFILEDDLTEAITVHERTIAVLENLIKMPLFFDSPDVKMVVDEALQNVKICQTATQKLVYNFTQRSKQRYIRVIETEEDDRG